MLQKYLFLFLLLITSLSLKSQSLSLKTYAAINSGPQFSLSNSSDPDKIRIDNRHDQAAFFMLAFARENRKENFWEIGMTWQLHKSANSPAILRLPPNDSFLFVDRGATELRNLQGQFEFNYRVFKEARRRWKPYLGWAINPYWTRYIFQSHQFYIFPQEKYSAGIAAGFVPHVQFNWNSKLSLDFNACFYLLSSSYEYSYLGNPVFTERQRTSGYFDFDMLQKYWLRAGLCWRFHSLKPDKI